MVAHEPTTTVRPFRLAVIVVSAAVAILTATVAALGVWSRSVLLDANGSERYVSRIIDSPSVVKGLGEHLGDQLVDLYDQNISFASRVPDALKDEAAKLDLTITEEIRERSLSVAASDTVRSAFSEALVELHGEVVERLTNNPVDSEVVRLNLVPAATALFRSLQESGAWPETPAVPEVDRSASPDQQAATLEEALGFDLPDGLSSVEILDEGGDGPDMAEVRGWVSSAWILTWIAFVVSVMTTGSAVLVARTIRARLWVVSIVVAMSSVSAWLIASQVPTRLASGVDDTTWAPAVDDIATTLLAPLSNSSLVAGSLAVVVAGTGEVVSRRRLRTVHRQGPVV